MERDWGCIRTILLALLEKPDPREVLTPSQIEGYPAVTVCYHMDLLDQAGLIRTTAMRQQGAVVHAVAHELTWQGHEFVAGMKSSKVWNEVLRIGVEKSIELTVDVVKTLVPLVVRRFAEQ